jgi:hypothetical protein
MNTDTDIGNFYCLLARLHDLYSVTNDECGFTSKNNMALLLVQGIVAKKTIPTRDNLGVVYGV